MNELDWNKLSEFSSTQRNNFRKERYHSYIIEMWSEIINNPDRDNNEIKSIWLNAIEHDYLMKLEFLRFVMSTRGKGEHRPIDWIDVLRFFRKKSFEEEKNCLSYKYN